MIPILILLSTLAAVFAHDVPYCLDPLLLLLGFIGMRIELRRMVLPALYIGFLRGTASLDPTWLHLLLTLSGVLGLAYLRRWFFAVRVMNQVSLTFVLGVVLYGGVAAPLLVAYPHENWIPHLQTVALVSGATALAAPLFHLFLDRVVLRPRHWRRGLLPATGA